MTREQYEMLQWLPKGEQAAMLQAQNAQFADGNADDLSAMRSATNAGVDSVFDQERNGTFDAVSDPNSETIKSETTTTNADGTKTTTTTSNPNNSPSGRVAEDAKNPDQIRVTTQDGRFSAMIDPSMLEQYAAAGYKPGPQTATPNGGTMTTPNASEFDRSTLEQPTVGLARGGQGRAVVDTKPESVMYSNGSQFPAYAVPGSPEAKALEALGYAQGGVGQASLVKPGVIGGPVLDTQQDAQQDIITTAGEKAAADALIANEGMGNSAITNQQAQDEARAAAEANAASNYTDVAGTTQAVIDQASPVDQVAAQASAFQQAEDDWATQDAADTADFLEDGRDEFQAIDDEVAWATDEFNFDNNIKDAFSDDELSAIEKDNEEGGFFSNILETMTGVSPEDIDGWLEGAKDWYKDNPELSAALITAAANYVATGSPYQSIGKGITAGVTSLQTRQAAEAKAAATVAKDAKDLATWQVKEDYKFKQELAKEYAKQQTKGITDAAKAESDQRIAEHNYAKEITGRLEQNYDKATMAKFFPGGLQGEVSGALKFIRDNYGVNVGNPDFDTDEVVGVGMKRYIDNLEMYPQQKGKAKLRTFFEDAAIMARGVNNGIDAGLFIDDNGNSNPKATVRAYEKIKNKAKKFKGNREETWRSVQTAYTMFQENESAYNAMLKNAKDQGEHGTPPFIYFINHEVKLVE